MINYKVNELHRLFIKFSVMCLYIPLYQFFGEEGRPMAENFIRSDLKNNKSRTSTGRSRFRKSAFKKL